jgi:hypothetical protein
MRTDVLVVCGLARGADEALALEFDEARRPLSCTSPPGRQRPTDTRTRPRATTTSAAARGDAGQQRPDRVARERCREIAPFVRLHVILRNALSLRVQQTEVDLRCRVPLLGLLQRAGHRVVLSVQAEPVLSVAQGSSFGWSMNFPVFACSRSEIVTRHTVVAASAKRLQVLASDTSRSIVSRGSSRSRRAATSIETTPA